MSQGSDPGCTTMTRTGASPPNSEVHVQAHVQDVQQIAKQQDPPPPPATKSAAANDQIRFYQKVKVVGKGNFAKVYRGFHTRTKDAVAIKEIHLGRLDQQNRLKIRREIEILKTLVHPNIVRLYQVMEDHVNDIIYLVTEFASGGEIFDFVVVNTRLEESKACKKFYQAVRAVEYLHSKGIVHRDIKAENLLLDDHLNVKLADFGFSNYFKSDGLLTTWCGSPPYAAPELFAGMPYKGPEVDVWSLGVVLYVLVVGTLPFEGESVSQLKSLVLEGRFRIPYFMSQDCERLLVKMLQKDPKKRATIKQVLEHEWMRPAREEDTSLMDEAGSDGSSEKPKWNELVINHMVDNCNCDRQLVIDCLDQAKFDDHAAIYFILEDRLRLRSQSTQATPTSAATGPTNGQRQRVARQPVARVANPLANHQLPSGLYIDQSRMVAEEPHRSTQLATTTLSNPPQSSPMVAHAHIGRNISHEIQTQRDPTLPGFLQQRRHTLVPGIAALQGGILQALGAPQVNMQGGQVGVVADLPVNARQQRRMHSIPRGLQGHPQVRQLLSAGPAVPSPAHCHPRLNRRSSDTQTISNFAVSQARELVDHSSGHLHASGGIAGVGSQLHSGQHNPLSFLEQGMGNLRVQTESNEALAMQATTRSGRHPPLVRPSPLYNHGNQVSLLQPIQSPSPTDLESMDDGINPHRALHGTESWPNVPPQRDTINRLPSAPHDSEKYRQVINALQAKGPYVVHPSQQQRTHATTDLNVVRRNSLDPAIRGLMQHSTGAGAHGSVASAASGDFRRPRVRRASQVFPQTGMNTAAYSPADTTIPMPAAYDRQTLAAEARSVEARTALSFKLTTMTMSLQAVHSEVSRVLTVMSQSVKYTYHEMTFTVRNTDRFEFVHFEINICPVPGISNIYTLRLNRISGDIFQYKHCSRQFIDLLKLT